VRGWLSKPSDHPHIVEYAANFTVPHDYHSFTRHLVWDVRQEEGTTEFFFFLNKNQIIELGLKRVHHFRAHGVYVLVMHACSLFDGTLNISTMCMLNCQV